MTDLRPDADPDAASAPARPPKKARLPRVLCVDDDAAVLRATTRVLATRFDVTMAIGGLAALDAVRQAAVPFAAVVSDLRMPELNGIGLLQCVRQHAPETTRVLLTGNADVASAVDAVNAGEIFRFLTKPCPPEALIEAVAAACAQHERAIADAQQPRVGERAPIAAALLDAEAAAIRPRALDDRKREGAGAGATVGEDAMRHPVAHPSASGQPAGCASVLRNVLGAVRPAASDCANRIERRVAQVLQRVHLSIAEHVTAAAALSQLGSVSVPVDVAERIYGGWALSADDRACAAGIRPRSAELLSGSDDLALVRAMLAPECLASLELADGSSTRVVEECEIGARIVDIACMLEDAERRGGERGTALKQLAELERAPDKHDGILLDAFRAAVQTPTSDGVRTMRLRDASPDMVLAADVVAPNGLLVARLGQRIGDMRATRTAQSWSSALLEQCVEVVEGEVADSVRTAAGSRAG